MLAGLNPKVHALELTDTYGRFAIEPLERGYGDTLGNAFRRVLLAHIEGASVTDVRIEGALHEFTTLKGIVEDATEIILNIRELAIKVLPSETEEEDEEIVLRLNAKGAGEVLAADIQTPPHVEIINPELHILEIANDKGAINIDMWVQRGVGYVPTEERDRTETPVDVIPVDAQFSPVSRANYRVEPTRLGSRTDLDRLVVEIWGNGTVSPDAALHQAARHLRDYIAIFLGPAEEAGVAPTEAVTEEDEVRNKVLDTPIEDVEFSVRTFNCLKKESINTLGELIQRNENDLLNIRNFGKRSLEEVLEKLAQYELGLKGGGEAG
ncbi:MAG: DNA-directed RNA polymerase subunit alpha [Armatimonadetes bacterium]|nr:DNA-directed RNA polymerase subunit alpha [Armatimonadota bacterium]